MKKDAVRARMIQNKPSDTNTLLLHSCCAPCSSAMVEFLMQNGITPVFFYYNPNIHPRREYEIRKSENKRYAESLGLEFIDMDWTHREWLLKTLKWRDEPERGERCFQCFLIRMKATAEYAHENGYSMFATTLATSRWKNLEQINKAGQEAAALFPGVSFWENNWRKGGLADRQREIIQQYNFYRQTYCGCEYALVNNYQSCRLCRAEDDKKSSGKCQFQKAVNS